jgi:hypothetical protein
MKVDTEVILNMVFFFAQQPPENRNAANSTVACEGESSATTTVIRSAPDEGFLRTDTSKIVSSKVSDFTIMKI